MSENSANAVSQSPVSDCCKKKESFWKPYSPLLLILLYLLGAVAMGELKNGDWNGMRMMTHFMGGFFVVFSFFKFLNLKGFVEAYQTYDLPAKWIPGYAWAYPFIELGLGISYLSIEDLRSVNWITLIVMSVSSIGVIQNIAQGKKIQCACLGTIFKLPMTKVTLFEDLLMVVMAIVGILTHV